MHGNSLGSVSAIEQTVHSTTVCKQIPSPSTIPIVLPNPLRNETPIVKLLRQDVPDGLLPLWGLMAAAFFYSLGLGQSTFYLLNPRSIVFIDRVVVDS